MKKGLKLLAILIALLVSFTTAEAQTRASTQAGRYPTTTFQCSITSISYWDNKKDTWGDEMTFRNQDIPITIKDDRVIFDNKDNTVVYLFKLIENHPDYITYTAIDNEGKSCSLQIVKANNGGWVIQIVYDKPGELFEYGMEGEYPF